MYEGTRPDPVNAPGTAKRAAENSERDVNAQDFNPSELTPHNYRSTKTVWALRYTGANQLDVREFVGPKRSVMAAKGFSRSITLGLYTSDLVEPDDLDWAYPQAAYKVISLSPGDWIVRDESRIDLFYVYTDELFRKSYVEAPGWNQAPKKTPCQAHDDELPRYMDEDTMSREQFKKIQEIHNEIFDTLTAAASGSSKVPQEEDDQDSADDVQLFRDLVYTAIDSELTYQDALGKDPDSHVNPNLSYGDALTAIRVNLEKAEREWYGCMQDYVKPNDYLRKIAALCVKMGVEHGMNARANKRPRTRLG